MIHISSDNYNLVNNFSIIHTRKAGAWDADRAIASLPVTCVGLFLAPSGAPCCLWSLYLCELWPAPNCAYNIHAFMLIIMVSAYRTLNSHVPTTADTLVITMYICTRESWQTFYQCISCFRAFKFFYTWIKLSVLWLMQKERSENLYYDSWK